MEIQRKITCTNPPRRNAISFKEALTNPSGSVKASLPQEPSRTKKEKRKEPEKAILEEFEPTHDLHISQDHLNLSKKALQDSVVITTREGASISQVRD